MSKNLMSKVSDFFIRIIMMFTTLIALLFFADVYSDNKFIFSFLALLFILALMIKGLADIFRRKK